jgi:hypothetical protein
VGFVVDKVALGQFFVLVLLFSPVNIIPSALSIDINVQIIWGMSNRLRW